MINPPVGCYVVHSNPKNHAPVRKEQISDIDGLETTQQSPSQHKSTGLERTLSVLTRNYQEVLLCWIGDELKGARGMIRVPDRRDIVKHRRYAVAGASRIKARPRNLSPPPKIKHGKGQITNRTPSNRGQTR